ncbi:MAG: DUF4118 domain-containing protein, partial [Gemmatimonadaceae bacterium]
MTRTEWRLAGRWVFWLAMLGLATATLHAVRGEIEQSHVTLTLLLVVLGASAGGGRWLGFALAIAGFILIDYFFQPPYDLLSVDKPLDWIVLLAFLASAFVATELMVRGRDEAETARRRMEEIASLSRIGSEMLRFARPEDALAAVTELVQHTIHVSRVAVLATQPSGLGTVVATPAGEAAPAIEGLLAERVAEHERDGAARAAAVLVDGSVIGEPIDRITQLRAITALALPLLVETRRVGVLVISARAPFELDGAQRRFLASIGHYAALGAERVRLVAEARHAADLREENRAKDEVLATVSHDLRTPLTTIKLLAQSAAARGEPNALAIEEQSDRLSEMVTNVLDLSRIRAGGVSLDIELNTAEDLVGAAIRRAGGLMDGRRIEPRLDLGDPPASGRFDFVQTLRIVGNVLDNALRYTTPGSSVEIETAREGEWLVIRIRDRGPG